MSEENRKIVIVVGAGASCDFVVSEDKKFNENHGNIKYEIWGNSQTIAYKDSDKNAKYFLSEKNRNNYSFPSGEALIKMISNSRKVFDFFGNEILDEIYKDVIAKINWNKHRQKDDIVSIPFKEKFLKYFFDYLKNPIYQNHKDSNYDIFSFDQSSLGAFIEQYEGEIGEIATIYALSKDKLRIQKFSDKTDFFNFIDIDNFKIREATKNQGNKEGVKFLNELLRENFKIKISQNEDVEIRYLKGIKLPSLFESILEVSSSRYLQISRLVNHYQPFSIDELLDSIKTNKIDVLEPLHLDSSELKNILKSDEEDSKKLEQQFRNELIDAGKTLIALFLLRSEKRELFDNPNSKNDSKIWYRHIRNLIINSGKNDEKIKEQIQNLTIISFNYDRSLDYYLRTRLSDYYGEIKERVFYPYGKLAVDNWDRKDYGKFNKDGKFNPYNDDELREIEELGQGLRVIGELDEDLSKKYPNSKNKNLTEIYKYKKNIFDFEKYCKGLGDNTPSIALNINIRQIEELKKSEKDNKIKDEINFILEKYKTLLALQESNKIYFLGFAFHQQNCDLLQLKNLLKLQLDQRNIHYTNFDGSESINKMVNGIFGIGKASWTLTLDDSKRKGVYDALMHDFKLGI